MKAVSPLAALGALLWASLASADTFPPAPPYREPAQALPLEQRVRALVQMQCASCHEGGALASQPGSFGAAFDLAGLSLDDLAADPGYVRPGFAVASPLFQKLMLRHRPSRLGPGGLAAAEILAIYDWIEGLPTPIACPIAPASESTPQGTDDTLVVSLRSVQGPCDPAGRLVELRAVAADLFGALSREAVMAPVDANGLLFEGDAAKLSRLTGADLEALRQLMARGVVGLDRLAAFVVERGLPLAQDARSRVGAIARMWMRDVDLRRAVAETGMSEAALREKLLALSGEAKSQAQRLLAGAVPRPIWEQLKLVLSGAAAAVAASSAEGTIDLLLTRETPRAKRGDVLSLDVVASAACHLSVVSIDPEGRAIVLYPNEIEDENLIARGVTVKVPGPTAGYQVRFDKAGTETFVAICQRGRTTLDGVKVDYEKQRFPVLGDWRGFLALMDERQSQIEKAKKTGETRRSRRRGRGREEAQKAETPPIDPKANIEGVAALRIVVE